MRGCGAGQNNWQILGMPIKASYCDMWYEACYNDLFCGGASGDFFECAELKSPHAQPAPAPGPPEFLIPVWAVVLLVVLAVLFLALAAAGAVLVRREMRGDPLFKPLEETDNPLPTSFAPEVEVPGQFEGSI